MCVQPQSTPLPVNTVVTWAGLGQGRQVAASLVRQVAAGVVHPVLWDLAEGAGAVALGLRVTDDRSFKCLRVLLRGAGLLVPKKPCKLCSDTCMRLHCASDCRHGGVASNKASAQYQVEISRSLRRPRLALPCNDGKAGPSGLETDRVQRTHVQSMARPQLRLAGSVPTPRILGVRSFPSPESQTLPSLQGRGQKRSEPCPHLSAAAHRCPEECAAREAAHVEVRPEADLRHRVQADVRRVLLFQL